MKKILLIVAAIALLAGVSSCKKDMEGKYAPKEKIQAVYQERALYYNDEVSYEVPKYKSEEWMWEKDRLNRITYYEEYTYESGEDGETETGHEVMYTQLFTYDGDGRLTKSEILGQVNMVATCEYDGKYLKTMTVNESGELVVAYQFNHDGKKITSFDLTLGDDFFDGDEKTMEQIERVNPLRFVLDVEPSAKVMTATKVCAKRAAKAGSKANAVLHFDLTWDGDNVSRMATSYMGATMQYAFAYDGKNNPYSNLFELVNMMDGSLMPYMALSKNNATKITLTQTTEGETLTQTEEYAYTYNVKDYPTSKTLSELWEDARYEQTYYYEYK